VAPRAQKPRRKKTTTDPAVEAARAEAFDHAGDLATAAMAAPGVGTRIASAARASLSIARLSPHNILMILEQADERGMTTPTSVGTGKQWRARGRVIAKGAEALWIVRPRGTDRRARDGEAVEAPAPEGGETGDEKPARPRFGRLAVFALSQTVPMDNPPDDIEADADADDIEGMAIDSLYEQVERSGYTVAHVPDGETLTVDHDTQTLTVPADAHEAITYADGDPVAVLADAVAEIVTRTRRNRKTSNTADGETVLTLAI